MAAISELLIYLRDIVPKFLTRLILSKIAFVSIAVFIISLVSQRALAQQLVNPGDSIWEINTRHLPCCLPAECDAPLVVRQLTDCCWQLASEESLIKSMEGESQRTIIYVHGNWMPVEDARARALVVYQLIAQRSLEPIRFISFSWPSEQRERPARDIITKKPLLSVSSFYLASFIRRLPPNQPLGMLGYSFGGAVACGSLHLLAGGAIDGYCLCEQDFAQLPIRVGLVAPAFDQYALSPSGRFGRSLEAVDNLYNLYNSRDPILRRFRFFDRDSDPVAAGFAGLSATKALLPLEANVKIDQHDCCSVGRSHYELEYLTCAGYRCLVDNLLGH